MIFTRTNQHLDGKVRGIHGHSQVSILSDMLDHRSEESPKDQTWGFPAKKIHDLQTINCYVLKIVQ